MNVKILFSLSLVSLATFNFCTASATAFNLDENEQIEEIKTEKSYSENGDQDEYSSQGSSKEPEITFESVYKGTVEDDGKYHYDLLSILKQNNSSSLVRFKTSNDNGFEDEDEDVVGDSVVFFMGYDPNVNGNDIDADNDYEDRLANQNQNENEEEVADEAQVVVLVEEEQVIHRPVYYISIFLFVLNYSCYFVMSYLIVWLILFYFDSKLAFKAQIFN